MMKLVLVIALHMVFVFKVNGHGGLVYPPSWVDGTGQGFDMNRYALNGCFEKAGGVQEKVFNGPNQLKSPNCYYNWFNNNVGWSRYAPKAQGSIQKLKQRVGSYPNDVRMRREMFIYKINDTLPNYNSNAKRADSCSKLDLSNTRQFRQYARLCTMPWFQPGLAELGSPCGVGGGNEAGHPGGICGHPVLLNKDGHCTAGFPGGKPAEGYSYPNAKTTTWTRGKAEVVGMNIHANHGGGYAYRLCKTPPQGIKGVTEDCFKKGHLNFVGPQLVRGEGTFKWISQTPLDSTVGTWPKGSMWRKNYYFTKRAGNNNYRGQIMDKVAVPKTLAPGNYVLSWRWDCEAAGQTWSTCANVKVV